MVRLDRIYTRGGDKGKTSLGDGTRVTKTHPRIAAYGTVDELNAVLGVVGLQRGLSAGDRKLVRRIQNELFDVGADLCVPRPPGEAAGERLRLGSDAVRDLESAIDARTRQLEPLRSFILPGGSPASAWLHLARVVCRRAEIQVAALVESDGDAVGSETLPYLNRLSDLLFVMARHTNDKGRSDVVWVPGGTRTERRPVAKKTVTRKRNPSKPRNSTSNARRGRVRS